MTPAPADLLVRTGAIQRGHFALTSGLHSDAYFQKARILEDPTTTMALAGEVASWYQAIEAVVAPAVGAIALGFAVALSAGARSLYAERERGRMALRRGFALRPGERTLVVEDVVTTGGSAREVHRMVEASGATAIGVAALVDRTTGPVGFPLRALFRVEAPSWAPEDCPLCRQGEPLVAPGSRHLSPS